MKYEVITSREGKEKKEIVEASFVKDENGLIFFYNKANSDDVDQPVAMYNKNLIIKIKQRKEIRKK